VIIIHMLHQIQQKLNDLEGRIEKLEKWINPRQTATPGQMGRC
jgi:hypothetical protein